ncbi:MAG: hypothetical protein ACYDCK_09095 [Thermoplasmatota archaeon]
MSDASEPPSGTPPPVTPPAAPPVAPPAAAPESRSGEPRSDRPPLRDPFGNDAFFTADAAAAAQAASLARLPGTPLRFAGALALVGLASILFATVGFVQRLIIVAPIFEEFLKFGVALALVELVAVRAPAFRVIVALAPGIAFGVIEHNLTYADENTLHFASRVLFHSGSAALAMSMWCALERLENVRYRWLATAPGTLLHAANNFYALVAGIAVVVAGADPASDALVVPSILLAIVAHALAWTLVASPRLVNERLVAELPARWFT